MDNIMERQAGFLDVMKYRDFRLLWTGQLISITGSQMRMVAVDWQVYEIATKQGFNPALALGAIGLMRVIPMTLTALFAGVAADRFERRKVIMVTSFIALFASIILALAGSLETPNLLIVYAMVVVTAIASAFEMPARQALTPALVPAPMLSQAGDERWHHLVAACHRTRSFYRRHFDCVLWRRAALLDRCGVVSCSGLCCGDDATGRC